MKVLKTVGIGFISTSILVSGCSDYSAENIKNHREKVAVVSSNYQDAAPKVKNYPVIEQEVELFNRKVTLTIFNQAVKNSIANFG
ncbi:hypothetical protein [Abyssogena phaseoliformis symbiont]|uniref:hypothetical protein n=1 Tax=Abyssogena phaseoliformis symbiont TaxID=596095 RepID=UPI0019158D26|nr:hypothetical protein [Abyssogena phaseoliformis symbiont]